MEPISAGRRATAEAGSRPRRIRMPARSLGRLPASRLHTRLRMSLSETFRDLACRLAREGAAPACAAQVDALLVRADREPPLRAGAIRRAARGLRIAARVLDELAPGAREAPFRPVGLRGAVAAGHVALAAGDAAEAELIGAGAAEAAPDSPAGLRLVGQALFAQARYGLAVRALRGALAADHADAFTRSLHVEALWFSGEREAARCALAGLRGLDVEGARLAAALHEAIGSGALGRAGGAP